MSSRKSVLAALRLGPMGWKIVARTAWVAVRAERSLRTETLDATARRFGLRLSFENPAHAEGEVTLSQRESTEISVALRTLTAGPFDSTCLRRALVIGDILRDREPLLRIGVAKEDGEVTAHAWVEVDDVALDPMADREYLVPRHPRGPGGT